MRAMLAGLGLVGPAPAGERRLDRQVRPHGRATFNLGDAAGQRRHHLCPSGPPPARWRRG
jgi:hypothetical protein